MRFRAPWRVLRTMGAAWRHMLFSPFTSRVPPRPISSSFSYPRPAYLHHIPPCTSCSKCWTCDCDQRQRAIHPSLAPLVSVSSLNHPIIVYRFTHVLIQSFVHPDIQAGSHKGLDKPFTFLQVSAANWCQHTLSNSESTNTSRLSLHVFCSMHGAHGP